MRKAAKIRARTLSLAVGATHSVVAQLESGKILDLKGNLLLHVAKALGTTMEFLLAGEGEEPTASETRESFERFKKAGEASSKVAA